MTSPCKKTLKEFRFDDISDTLNVGDVHEG